MNDDNKAIDKLHNAISKANKSLRSENPTEPFDTIAEYVLYQTLNHYSPAPTKEAIISILSFWIRRDYADSKDFVDRINKML